MNVPTPAPSQEPDGQTSEPRLGSWKEIAAYVKRDVSTVQRWEKREGMPVHRHLHDKRGSVYAVPSELDRWLQSRRPNLDTELEEQETARDNRTARRALIWAAFVVAVLTIGIFTYLYIHSRTIAAPKIHSLAVLPLRNLSGDPSQDYLADGITEAVIGRLCAIRNLHVTSHTSVVRFKNTQLSVPEIAKSLGVDAIVEGSVIRERDRIRVTAQLIRGATDEHFWSESYDRQIHGVLALESDVAQAIAQKVQVTLSGNETKRLTAVREVAPEVYESYLKGRFALNRSNNRPDIEESIRLFQDAIKRDPTFAPAYLALARADEKLSTIMIGASPAEMRPKALVATQKALELDPDSAEAHVLLASLEQRRWNWAAAEAEYRRALQLNPNDANAYSGYADWMLTQGRPDDALELAQHGRKLDPIAVTGADLGWIQFHRRHFDEAEREYRSALALNPKDAGALWGLGFVLIAKGQPAEAIAPMEEAVSISNRGPGPIGVLIRAYAQAGRRDDALRLLSELQERKKKGYIPAASFVNAYLGLGDTERAFAAFENAFKEQSNILQWLKVHPYFDPVRDDPRFQDLLRRVGLN